MDQRFENTDRTTQPPPFSYPLHPQPDFRAAIAHLDHRLTVARLALDGDHSDRLEQIIEHVSRRMRVNVATLKSASRVQHAAFTRQMAMYLCRKVTGASFPSIAARLNRDHSTVI